jgi:hypothetical protein
MADLPTSTPSGPLTPGSLPVGPMPPADVSTQNSPNAGALTPPAQTPVALAPPQQPAAPAIPPHIGKLAGLGHIFNTLAGGQTQYNVDPKTGQTVSSTVPRKPGQMFRDMLAGALMGGSAGAGHDFGVGAVKGGAAVVQDQRQQDLLRRNQAQQQFGNQLEAQRNQREQTGFETSETLKKAEIAHMNIQTVRENQLIQGESFKIHAEQSDFGKAQIQPFLDAGIKPVYKDIPESQMQDIIKNNKDAGTLMWEPTGVKTGIDKNGAPTYESTYTAVNPEGQITVTQGMLDTFKKSGMDTYDPGLFDTLKPGRTIDARQYMSLVNRSQGLMNNKLANEKTQAETEEARARGKQAQAAAAKDYAERDNYLEGKNKAGAFNKALANLNKVGDFDKLTAGDKLILGESARDSAKGALDAYKIAKGANDETAASEALQDYQFYNGLVKSSLGQKPAPTASGAAAPAAGTPEGEAARTAQTLGQQAQEKQDKDLVSQYEKFTGSNAQLAGALGGQSDVIRATLKSNPKWTTAEKARYIRSVTQPSGGGGGTIPPGALTASNPQTGQKKYSTDGGKTWIDAK